MYLGRTKEHKAEQELLRSLDGRTRDTLAEQMVLGCARAEQVLKEAEQVAFPNHNHFDMLYHAKVSWGHWIQVTLLPNSRYKNQHLMQKCLPPFLHINLNNSHLFHICIASKRYFSKSASSSSADITFFGGPPPFLPLPRLQPPPPPPHLCPLPTILPPVLSNNKLHQPYNKAIILQAHNNFMWKHCFALTRRPIDQVASIRTKLKKLPRRRIPEDDASEQERRGVSEKLSNCGRRSRKPVQLL
ncbi:hypothetical protein LXL04_016219 [Taraxacum kok-saghyz]